MFKNIIIWDWSDGFATNMTDVLGEGLSCIPRTYSRPFTTTCFSSRDSIALFWTSCSLYSHRHTHACPPQTENTKIKSLKKEYILIDYSQCVNSLLPNEILSPLATISSTSSSEPAVAFCSYEFNI